MYIDITINQYIFIKYTIEYVTKKEFKGCNAQIHL